jgi:lipopolysaccharide transport system permease protein
MIQAEWTEEIKPKSSLLSVDLTELWRYRDLLMMFVRRDVVSVYKQTILGPIWFFVQPIFTTLVFVVVFGNIAAISTDGLPMPLFYMSGIVLWNYFAECFNKTATTFRDNAGIFGKVYFPRLVMPLSVVISAMLKLLIQLGLLTCFWLWYQWKGPSFATNAAIMLLPVLIVLMALLGLGSGLIITSLTTKYRDLTFLIAFGVQLLMYATPVIYPISSVPERYRFWVQYNPLTAIIEAFRYGLLGKGSFTPGDLLYSTSTIIGILLVGIVVFNRVEKNFMDTV